MDHPQAPVLDDRMASNKVLERAQELMADAVHAEQTFFSTCGSSLSVKSAMLAVAGPGEKLLVGRDAHKAVVSGLILSGVRPIWVEPQWDASRNLAHPPSPDAFAARLDEHPDARGALVTSPTPYGTCADLAAIAAACHERGKPLIVDEAWGRAPAVPPRHPHVGDGLRRRRVRDERPQDGRRARTGSVFHQQGNLVAPAVLKAREDLLGTTSPSVLIYAGLDGWRRQMVEHGHALLQDALDLAAGVRAEIADI
ncbi:hypothetical protein ABZ806_42285 [Spirillospora sp. NPDC047418]